MYIDRKSPIPVYHQLKKIILEEIKNGNYIEGSLIPSERELGEILNISRMTVRQALNQLVSEGVLYREKGKGTFVSRLKFEQRNVMSFSDIVKKTGLLPSTKVLHFSKEEATPYIKDMLGVGKSELVYNLKRLRLANGTPIAIEEVFIPETKCPNLESYDLTTSLYKLMREQYSQTISYVDSAIESAKPCKKEKDLLGISGAIPVMKITSINFSKADSKLFYERSIYRSDEYKYNVRIYVHNDIE